MTEGLNTWLITGSSRGFGAELVTAVLDGGDAVLATARRPEDIKQPQEEYRERFRTAPLDVTNPRAAEAALALAVSEFGSLAVVVNNAGYANSASIEEMGPKDFRAQIEANLFGVVNVTRAALPILRGQGFGTFVQFPSVGGRVGGTPGMGAYQTGTFAVEGFSEVLANEVKPFGIDVVIVEPGGVPDRPARLVDATPPRRTGLRPDRRRVQPDAREDQRNPAWRSNSRCPRHR